MRARTVVLSCLALVVVAGESSADPTEARAAVVVGRFSTTYATDAEHKSRAFNVQLAADAIDGKRVAPGATFSFNDAVGERTAAFGFAKSVVIRDAMIAEGMGGGTCQVASTLHSAALLAGLEIVARAPHSRPSAYIRMGLDATVAYGSIDLKLRNRRPEAVTLHARAVQGTLDVWVDGPSGSKEGVTVTSEILATIPFSRVVAVDKSLTDDAVHRTAFGIPGYRVRRTREIRASDGTVRRDVRVDEYPPTSEVLHVASAVDATSLRRPPEAASSDDESGPAAPKIVVDPHVVRPARVQLRPSTSVVIDNE